MYQYEAQRGMRMSNLPDNYNKDLLYLEDALSWEFWPARRPTILLLESGSHNQAAPGASCQCAPTALSNSA